MHLLWSASFPTVPLSAVYHLLCAPTNLTGVACVFSLLHTAYTSEPGHLQYVHTMWSPRSETAPLRFSTADCAHSLTRDNWSVSGLRFSCLQYCFSYRMIVEEENLFFFQSVPLMAWLRSHQSCSDGSIYLWQTCHMCDFERGLYLQRGWTYNVSIILKCYF